MLGTTWEESGLGLAEKHATYFSNNYIDESIWGFQAEAEAHYFDDTPNSPYGGGLASMVSHLFSTWGYRYPRNTSLT